MRFIALFKELKSDRQSANVSCQTDNPPISPRNSSCSIPCQCILEPLHHRVNQWASRSMEPLTAPWELTILCRCSVIHTEFHLSHSSWFQTPQRAASSTSGYDIPIGDIVTDMSHQKHSFPEATGQFSEKCESRKNIIYRYFTSTEKSN